MGGLVTTLIAVSIIGYFMIWLLVADVAWYVVVLINNLTLVVTGKGLFERIAAKFKK